MAKQLIFGLLVAAVGAEKWNVTASMKKGPTSMDMKCVAKHCPGKMAAAVIDPKFYQATACTLGCNKLYYSDTTIGKLHYQNCTTKCQLTYESKAGDEFTGCAMENNCIQFAPINVTCPKPDVDPNSSLESLKGEWWQHYGKNALWDCYPCQHIHEMKIINDTEFCSKTVFPGGKTVEAPCWSYSYSYDLYTETDTKYFGQTWQLPGNIPKGKAIDIYYQYMGSTHNETWYILKAAERYVLLVDCSYMSGWTNVGSIVWVRPNVDLNQQELDEISVVYKEKLGWDFPSDFCADRYGPDQCDGPSLKNQNPFQNRRFRLI